MRFSTLTTILAVVLGASATPASDVVERGGPIATATMCTDKNRGGACLEDHIEAVNHCFQISDGFAGKISSVFTDDTGVIITLFSNSDCNGGLQLDVVAPGINNLEDFGFNDQARGIKANFR
ncbi:hypothetical protein EJ04DRAFT_521710 [Polyplosphaeria fusca]|uniref:Uncharacterized protein n=1 Tax=Polyplosphaeria fusca TaxID=682080 RepID=A0A9P4V4R9_9PLEO|nr:hypothetical protein EJ04DRAFT_521710 [Polyplosphaeria fusca]